MSELQRALYQFRRLSEDAQKSGGKLVIATEKKHLPQQDSPQPPPVVGILAVEGLSCLKGDLENVDVLWKAGARILGKSGLRIALQPSSSPVSVY